MYEKVSYAISSMSSCNKELDLVFLSFCGLSCNDAYKILSKEFLKSELSMNLTSKFVPNKIIVNVENNNIKNLQYCVVNSPFGNCVIAVKKGSLDICFLGFFDGSDKQDILQEIQNYWQPKKLEKNKKIADKLNNLVFLNVGENPINVIIRGTIFQTNVLKQLAKLKMGNLITYSDLAEMVGKPKAFRATASAIANNNISYLIPCHRVVSKSNSYNQYQWGLVRKKAMALYENSKKFIQERL